MTTPFEDEVLGRVSNDYEAAHTITGDIARDLKRPVTEAEVLVALLNLAHSGLVQAYVYDASNKRYRAIAAGEAKDAKELWFKALPTQQFDVTRERIRQIERRALEKLRKDGKP